MSDVETRASASLMPGAGLTLAEVAREIPGRVEVHGDPEVRVLGIRHDSRLVDEGDLFVARRGATSNGAAFVEQARARGARAILALEGAPLPEVGLPVVRVADVADGIAYAAAALYGHPSFAMDVVGITGTNGKTTTAHLVRAAVDAAVGHPACGTVGTVGHTFRGETVPAEHTTPEADELSRVLAAMRARGATHVAMEVSSIALALGRARAIHFRVAAITNLTHDHLDFHGSMEAYADAKALLFTRAAPGVSVVPVDHAFGRELLTRVTTPLLKVSAIVGTPEDEADFAPRALTLSDEGIDLTLRTPVGDVRLVSRLLGAHNVENIVLALGVAHALELDLHRAARGIASEGGAPGRLERCDEPGDDLVVLVDYAHTPDALERVLAGVRTVSTRRGRRIHCVFGCGGDRDPKKRGPMGEAAGRGADVAILTSDNPRTEDPATIAMPVQAGLVASGRSAIGRDQVRAGQPGYRVELDRARAIAEAVADAAPGDVVLLAGKGHEDYQVVGATKHPFDDRVHAREALGVRRGGKARAR